MHSDTVITIQHVSKKFRLFSSPKERLMEALHPFRKRYHHEFWALHDVSFDVRRGEIIGILGRNGSGKSTLLQIICSVMQPTSGDIHVNGRISALLELGAGFNPEFTGRDNVILNGAIMGLSRKEMLDKISDIETFADIGEFFDQPVKTYSSGMFVRVAFAAAIHVDPEILIVDEALSVGDSKFQHRCFQRIREFMEQGKTIVVVSHSTDMLLRLCQRGVVLDAGELRYVGQITSAVNCYQNLLFGPKVQDDTSLEVEAGATRRDDSTSDGSDATGLLIGSLSEDIEDRIHEKRIYNNHETRLGNREVQIIDFDIIADAIVNPLEIPSHSDMQLIIKMRFNENMRGVSVGFALISIDGLYIFGTNLAMMGAPLISADAGKCLAVKFHWTSYLAGGEYFLNIGCTQFVNGEDHFVDVRRSVAKIKCSDTPDISGFIDLGVTHEVVALPAQTLGGEL